MIWTKQQGPWNPGSLNVKQTCRIDLRSQLNMTLFNILFDCFFLSWIYIFIFISQTIKHSTRRSVIILSSSCLQWCIQSFLGNCLQQRLWGANVMPLMDPWRNPGAAPGDEVTWKLREFRTLKWKYKTKHTLYNMYLIPQ